MNALSVTEVSESLPQCVVRCPTDAVLNAAERSPEGHGVAVIDLIDRVTDWDWQMRNGRVPAWTGAEVLSMAERAIAACEAS